METETLALKPGIIDNLAIDLDCIRWRGSRPHRTPIGLLALDSFNESGNPVYRSSSSPTEKLFGSRDKQSKVK